MKYNIRGEKTRVTSSMKNYVMEKLSKMDKYFENPDAVEAKVLVSVKGNNQKIEVTINTTKYNLRVEEDHNDFYAACDLVIDKIERQFRKFKTKLIDKQRREEVNLDLEDYFDEPIEQIIKRKKIFLKPMDEEEAIVQMELLGHSFFIFKNSDTKSICAIYKRKDGDYGFIETE